MTVDFVHVDDCYDDDDDDDDLVADVHVNWKKEKMMISEKSDLNGDCWKYSSRDLNLAH